MPFDSAMLLFFLLRTEYRGDYHQPDGLTQRPLAIDSSAHHHLTSSLARQRKLPMLRIYIICHIKDELGTGNGYS